MNFISENKLDLIVLAVIVLIYFLFRKKFHSRSRGMPPFGGSGEVFWPVSWRKRDGTGGSAGTAGKREREGNSADEKNQTGKKN